MLSKRYVDTRYSWLLLVDNSWKGIKEKELWRNKNNVVSRTWPDLTWCIWALMWIWFNETCCEFVSWCFRDWQAESFCRLPRKPLRLEEWQHWEVCTISVAYSTVALLLTQWVWGGGREVKRYPYSLFSLSKLLILGVINEHVQMNALEVFWSQISSGSICR